MEEGCFQNQRIIGFLKRFNAERERERERERVCVCVF